MDVLHGRYAGNVARGSIFVAHDAKDLAYQTIAKIDVTDLRTWP